MRKKKEVVAVPQLPAPPPPPTPPPEQAALAKLSADSNPLLHQAHTLVVNATTIDSANALLLQLASAKRALTAKRDFFIKPLKTHVKTLELLFKPLALTLEEADSALRNRVVAFRESERKAAEAERQRLVAEAAKAVEEAEKKRAAATATSGKKAVTLAREASELDQAASVQALAAVGVSTPQKTSVANTGTAIGTVTGVLRWDFEVVQIDQVPREYLKVDETLVRKAIKSGLREIAGVRIFQNEGLSVGVVEKE